MGSFRAANRWSTSAWAVAALACWAAAAGPARAAVVFTDDFNRGSADNLGPNWVARSGTLSVVNNAVRAGASPAAQVSTVAGYAETNPVLSVDARYVSASFAADAEVGVVARFASVNDMVNVRVAHTPLNGTIGFNTLIFAYGGGTSTWPGITGGPPLQLIDTFRSGRLTVAVNGSNVTASIDTDGDGVANQTFTRGGLPTTILGTGVGLQLYLNTVAVEADNFAAVPEPASALGLAAAAAAGLLARRRRRAR